MFQKKLLNWYQKHKRDLPWRRTRDPYAIWISEIMLQQTTVATVIPYYERFLKRFPTIQALASSTEEEVCAHWSGLGYYSRARNLRKGAMMLGDGSVPDDVESLMKIPGIGRYTAGAIASIAFEKRVPILDGNVMRVLSRLFLLKEDPRSTEGQKIFWKKAEEILPQKDLGDFNQSLMELGATVCIPENPLCLVCPVQKDCLAFQKGVVGDYPLPKKKMEYVNKQLTAAVFVRKNSILMVQRKKKGLLKDFWEVPMVEGDAEALKKIWSSSSSMSLKKSLKPIRHSVLNQRLTITPWICDLESHSTPDGRWISLEKPISLPTIFDEFEDRAGSFEVLEVLIRKKITSPSKKSETFRFEYRSLVYRKMPVIPDGGGILVLWVLWVSNK